MHRLIIACLLASAAAFPVGAAVSSASADSTRQQGIVIFHVVDPAQCTVTVYQDAAHTVKVDDTNNAVFSNSESCNRANNIVNGTRVTAVVGKRTSEVASDGKMHSRSLEVSHTYYAVINDTTDGTTASVSFTTANIPWGDTHIEEVPYSDTGFNHWAYPDLDWSDAGLNTWYVDPVSGVGFKRTPRNMYGLGGPNGSSLQSAVAFGGAVDVNSAWTNAQNALSTSSAGPFASYSGTGRAPIYLPVSVDPTNGDTLGSAYAGALSGPQIEDIRANVYGYAADTGNIEDRKVLVCLATQYNPAVDTCNAAEAEVTLPTTAGTVQFPSSFPSWQFAGWNVGRALTQDDVGIPNSYQWGRANVTNSSATLTNPLLYWLAGGMKINIGGTWYTVATVADAQHFTLAESGVNLTGQYYYLGNFGIRIRKKTATNNQINVAASYSIAWSTGIPMPANGVADFCSQLTFTVGYAADGTTPLSPTKQGRLCYHGKFLFMLADDGETRYLSPLFHGDSSMSGTDPRIPLRPFSATDPLSLIAEHTDDVAATATQLSLYTVTYDAATCHFKTWAGNNYNYATVPSDCMRWTNRMPHAQSKSLTDQISSAVTSNPLWDVSFGVPQPGLVSMISGRWAVLAIVLFQQNAPCFEIVVDMSTWTVVKVVEPMTGTTLSGFRWGGCHGVDLIIPPGANYGVWGIDNLAWTGYVSGPYINPAITAKSFDGGATWNSDTSLAAGLLIDTATSGGKCGTQPWVKGSQCVDQTNAVGPCGTNPYGVTGYQCVKLKMSGNVPCSKSPSSLEASKWPCSWHSGWAYGPGGMTIQPNDYILDVGTDGNSFNAKGEKLRVLSIAPDGSGNYIIEAQRWSTCDNPTSDYNDPIRPAVLWFTHADNSGMVHPNGWMSGMAVTQGCSATNLWVNLDKPLNQTDWYADNTLITSSHYTIGLGSDGTSTTQVGPGSSRTGTLPAVLGSPPNHYWSDSSSYFNGIQQGSGGEVEAYPAMGNWTAATQQQRSLVWDFRHINPDSGTSPEDPKQMWAHNYQLVAGQSSTYKMDIYKDLGDFKSRPVNVFSTRSAFKNISGPSSTIDDTKPWTYCQAYVAGECRVGSAKGDLFVVAPVNSAASQSYCLSDSYKIYTPCANPLMSKVGWMVEMDAGKDDPLGNQFRRITMGLTGPAAQYQYTSPHMTPDGKFAFVRAGYVNGVRADPLLIRMPQLASDDSVDRSTFIPIPVSLPSGSGYARVRFGYAENGAPTNFYCTSRQEACLTDGTVAPFALEQSDTLAATDCRSGCTMNIPALSGRVVYYRVEKSNDGLTGWVSGPTHAKGVN